MTTPAAKAQTISVTLLNSQEQPISQGPVGTQVIVQITNYPSSDYSFTVTFGTANVGTIETGPTFTTASTLFYVPTVALGKYTVTVTGSEGETGTATFTVTQPPPIVVTPGPTGTQTGTSSGTPTSSPTGGIPTNYYPYGTGPPSKAAGFWSPLAIGVVAFVVAVACFTTVVFVRRGRQGPARLENGSSYKPGSPAGSTQPTSYKPTAQETSPYGYKPAAQPTSPYSYRSRYSAQETSPYSSRYSTPQTRYTATPQYNQTATTRLQPPAHTKVCKHCKRDVREDLNVCPYCFKKLK
jgi:hypothetical protein